jgi:hypothetical protein
VDRGSDGGGALTILLRVDGEKKVSLSSMRKKAQLSSLVMNAKKKNLEIILIMSG